MACKTIGELYAGQGARYFLKYCPKCHESIYWNKEEAQEFMQNASRWIMVKHHIFPQIKLPRIRVEWGSGTQLLTTQLDKNIIENENTIMKLNKKPITEQSQSILKLRQTGMSIVEIGKLFGITRQRVYAVLKRYGDTLPRELAQAPVDK